MHTHTRTHERLFTFPWLQLHFTADDVQNQSSKYKTTQENFDIKHQTQSHTPVNSFKRIFSDYN